MQTRTRRIDWMVSDLLIANRRIDGPIGADIIAGRRIGSSVYTRAAWIYGANWVISGSIYASPRWSYYRTLGRISSSIYTALTNTSVPDCTGRSEERRVGK